MDNSLPKKHPKPKALGPKAKKRIQWIKNGLVLQVATEKGPFWDEVRQTRARWGIEAPTRLPPEDRNLLYPEQILRVLRGEAKLTEQHIYDRHNWERDIKQLWLWLVVLGLERYRLDVDWWPLMAALALFQPPLDRLLEFAKYGGIVRKDPFAEYPSLGDNPEFQRREAATKHDPGLASPLISRFPDPYSFAQAHQDYYETLMEEINKRFLKPQGLDIHKMRDEVLRDGTLDESLQERLRQIPEDLYIEVPKNVTVDELREAAGLAVSVRGKPEKAEEVKASKTSLVKVELAYRFYVLGQSFPDLPEQRYLGVESAETYKKYANDGRKLLAKTAE